MTRKYRKKSLKTKAKNKYKKLFSIYIRRRYADSDGCVACVTCQCVMQWKNAQAGHFIHSGNGTYESTYDERNVHVQCVQCNCLEQGMGVEYFIFMEREYGREVIEELRIKRKSLRDMTLTDYLDGIKEYERKIAEL